MNPSPLLTRPDFTHAFCASKAMLTSLLAVLTLLAGCDQNREAREAAQREAARHEIIATELRSKQDRIRADIAASEREIASQNKLIAEMEQRRATQRAELMAFLSENKAAATALAAAGGGAAVMMDDDIRSSLNSNAGEGASGLAFIAGLIGAGYCLANGEECTRVATRIGAYATANKDTDANIQRAKQQIASLQQGIEPLKKSGNDITPRLREADSAAESARARAASLACKGILC